MNYSIFMTGNHLSSEGNFLFENYMINGNIFDAEG